MDLVQNATDLFRFDFYRPHTKYGEGNVLHVSVCPRGGGCLEGGLHSGRGSALLGRGVCLLRRGMPSNGVLHGDLPPTSEDSAL